MESVILSSPIIIIGYILALALCLFALLKRAHISVTVISVGLFAASSAYALLRGADLYEVGAVCCVFFIINLLPLWKKGGKDK